MSNDLPVWVTLSLQEPMTPKSFCASAARLGVKAEPTSSGQIQLPNGFLAWVEADEFPERLLDTSATEADVEIGPACLHISGGTNELERSSHQAPEAIRRMKAAMHADFAAMTGTSARIISSAGQKVERLTGLLRGLLPLCESVIFPQANHLAFPADEFEETSAGYGDQNYHFPLYVFSKLRNETDGAYASSTGLALFGLPDLAMPLKEGIDPVSIVRAMGNLEREMVAEGWWPGHLETFTTELGPVRIERVEDALFVVPTQIAFDEHRLALARHRFTLERCAARMLGRGTMHRDRGPSLVTDHHLLAKGPSFAMTNGVSFFPQKGGTVADENQRVEALLMSENIGPWATKWLAWVTNMLRGHDGSRPIRPYDRLALDAPVDGIAGVIVWPWGNFPVYGEPIHLWSLVPILEEELAAFRANPLKQSEWGAERAARRDLFEILGRWSRFE
jgi:hypothetical protein